MDGEQFDTMTKAATLGGRRAVLRNLGLLAGGLAALVGANEVGAQRKPGRKLRTKKRRSTGATARPERRGGVRAAAKPDKPAKDCCEPCPPTGNECTIAVRDAATGQCEQALKRSQTPCGTNGFCQSLGQCTPCSFTLCPDNNSPDLVYCANFEFDDQHCGRCGNICPEGTFCDNGQCV